MCPTGTTLTCTHTMQQTHWPVPLFCGWWVLLLTVTAATYVGQCRRCYWAYQHECTPPIALGSRLYQRFPYANTTYYTAATATARLCTRPVQRDADALLRYEAVGPQPWYLHHADATPNLMNVPPVTWRDGQAIVVNFTFPRLRSAHPAYHDHANQRVAVTAQSHRPWAVFTPEIPLTAALTDPRNPPIKRLDDNFTAGPQAPDNTSRLSQLFYQAYRTTRGPPRTWAGDAIVDYDGGTYSGDPVEGPLEWFQSSYWRLYCLPHTICERLPDRGCTGLGVCDCAIHGTCTASGRCLCDDGWGGRRCNETIPADFFPENATVCPTTFDLCAGRGRCRPRPGGGVGVECVCQPGWFGGEDHRARTNLSLPYTAQLDLYASLLWCGPLVHAWTTQNTTSARYRYPLYHQCVLWDGDHQDPHWTQDDTVPSVPVAPFTCADHRQNTEVAVSARVQYGGFWCLSCAHCDATGTLRCEDADADLAAFNATSRGHHHAQLQCVCRDNYGGRDCATPICPWSARHTTSPWAQACDADLQHGHCQPQLDRAIESVVHTSSQWDFPARSWPGNYSGRCVCEPGWGGSSGACDTWLHPVCGHGQANTTGCVTDWVAFAPAASCVQQCMDTVDCNTDSDGCCATYGGEWSCCSSEARCASHNRTYPAMHCNASSACVCDPHYTHDVNGSCTRARCAEDCHGVVVAGSVADPVCTHSYGHPQCECWRALASPAAGGWPRWAGVFRGEQGSCTQSYAEACVAPDGRWCGDHGECFPAGCGAGWNASACISPDSPPRCACSPGWTGTHCTESVCGSSCSQLNATTGTCNTLTRQCECLQGWGGTGCTTRTPNCWAHNNTMCSYRGECDARYDTCVCGACALGSHCNVTNYPIPCGSGQGNCWTGNTCECLRNWRGVDCSEDACVATGGQPLTPNVCNCSLLGDPRVVQYPAHWDAAPLHSTFRGCRRPCPRSPWVSSDAECGGFGLVAGTSRYVSRCDQPTAANNPSVLWSGCNCSGYRGVNPFTQTVMDWTDDGHGACRPVCLHCNQHTNGTCATGQCLTPPCQYTGPQCDQPICGHKGHWNGTHCDCPVAWLYQGHGLEATTRCGAYTTNEPTVCTLSGGTNPTPPLQDRCNCPTPWRVDTDETSPTFRTCTLSCLPGGVFNVSAGNCSCGNAYGGPNCDRVLCVTDRGVPRANSSKCECTQPQFNGTLCHDVACIGGTALSVWETGCSCYRAWQGVLCNESACGAHGTPTGTGESDFCVCDGGWSGELCDHNDCGATLPITPVPCGVGTATLTCPAPTVATDHYCRCGVISVFESGGCSAAVCVHGELDADYNNTLVCRCEDGYTGASCTERLCAALDNVTAEVKVVPVVPTAHHPGAVGQTACACRTPYTDLATTNCTVPNCTRWRHPYLTQALALGTWTTVVQLTAAQNASSFCGCNHGDYRPEPYHPALHYLGIYNRSVEEVEFQALVNQVYMCVINCNNYHTVARHYGSYCECVEGWSGARCDVATDSDRSAPVLTWPTWSERWALILGITPAPTPQTTSAPAGAPWWGWLALVVGAGLASAMTMAALVSHRLWPRNRESGQPSELTGLYSS